MAMGKHFLILSRKDLIQSFFKIRVLPGICY
jgi:hypothetical protein